MPSGPPYEPAGSDKTARRTSASETDSGVTEEISGRSDKPPATCQRFPVIAGQVYLLDTVS